MKKPIALIVLLGMALAPAAVAQPDAWMSAAPMSTPRAELSAVVLEGKIYAIGGRDEDGKALRTVERYDPSTEQWEEVAPMNRARYGATAVVWDGRILVIGGRGPEDDDGVGNAEYEALSSVEAYVPASDTWQAFPELEDERSGAAAVVFNESIYVFGGTREESNEGKYVFSIERYEPSEQEWEELDVELPSALVSMAAVAVGEEVLLIGGFNPAPVSGVLSFNREEGLSSLQFSVGPPRGGLAATVVGDSVFVLGGRGTSGAFRNAHLLFRQGATLRMEEGEPMSTARADLAAVTLNDTVYVLGGEDQQGRVLASTEALQARGTATQRRPAPPDFTLQAAHPNPFQQSTRLVFSTTAQAASQHATVRVYDLQGRRVATLVDRVLPPGTHEARWNGTGASGQDLPAGTYLIQLQQGRFVQWEMTTLVR